MVNTVGLGLVIAGCLAIVYTWIAFPLLVLAWARLRPVRIRREEITPDVTVLLACLNEAAQLAERIENLLALDYPRERLEIVVASDGSTDQTAAIAAAYADRGVHAVSFPQRRGKASVHNDLMLNATGEIVVFTDADVRFPVDFLRRLVRPFADPRVGGVLAEINFVNRHANGLTQSRGIYWRFETALRQWLGDAGLLATGSGPGMAFRRSVLRKLAKPSYDTDFITALDAVGKGFLVVQEPGAVITDLILPTGRGEFRADARMTAKNFPGTLERWLQIGPLKHPCVSWALVSHKFFRWLTPWFMLAVLLGSALLATKPLGQVLLGVQAMFYGGALWGSRHRGQGGRGLGLRLLGAVSSFCLANAAFFWGTLRGFWGRPITTYQNLK